MYKCSSQFEKYKKIFCQTTKNLFFLSKMFHKLLKNMCIFEYCCILILYRCLFWILQIFTLPCNPSTAVLPQNYASALLLELLLVLLPLLQLLENNSLTVNTHFEKKNVLYFICSIGKIHLFFKLKLSVSVLWTFFPFLGRGVVVCNFDSFFF